ncbi:transcriptional regulator with XRE-family HTH domain [Saccharothrix coeruleofusca]|uniref:helix-turn-helix transcriptional regulator n=1 Tax=Saccharothrix coeruleofusca TaxID=33919 RepID=UPI001AEAB666|nr:helix-turn-helix transcriptional regulator [Saccharothrix coeruleofusca]MBP2340071.1 transcriptional regulator with XRE-family HTH domain [Saccharothrix coeruleofusca]
MDRRALGQFLRRRREALTPADVGLVAVGRRRTPGLRREEVAAMAHCSTDHYTRLEQARGSAPSRHVLHSIARALRLDDTERDHLLALADDVERVPGSPSVDVPRHVRDLIDRLPLTAALVRDARSDVLAWNPLAAVLLSGFFTSFHHERNLLRRYFLHPDPDVRYLSRIDEDQFARQAVAALRGSANRYPHDARTRRLVAELRDGSAWFREMWAEPVRPGGRSGRKSLRHPAEGTLTLNYDVLDVPDRDHQVVLFTAAPGSRSEEALRKLARRRRAAGPRG